MMDAQGAALFQLAFGISLAIVIVAASWARSKWGM